MLNWIKSISIKEDHDRTTWTDWIWNHCLAKMNIRFDRPKLIFQILHVNTHISRSKWTFDFFLTCIGKITCVNQKMIWANTFCWHFIIQYCLESFWGPIKRISCTYYLLKKFFECLHLFVSTTCSVYRSGTCTGWYSV